MTSSVWRGAAALVILLMGGAIREADACECMASGPPCQAAWQSDAVFAGTVISAEPIGDASAGQYRRLLRIAVKEAFVNASTSEVSVESSSLSTCDYPLRVGESYIVYASKSAGGRRVVSICSGTRPLKDATEDLRYLRSLPTHGTGGRIYGRINEWARHPAEPREVDHGPLENVLVNVRGVGFSRDVRTDAQGRYEVSGVPVGDVEVTTDAPFASAHPSLHPLRITDVRGCVRVDFVVNATAVASGVVVDQQGRPVPGVSIEAVAAELAGYRPDSFHYPARTDARGVFTIENLPPGEYVFGVNLTKSPSSGAAGQPTFLPGTAIPKDATIVTLAAGDRRDVGVLRLPQR